MGDDYVCPVEGCALGDCPACQRIRALNEECRRLQTDAARWRALLNSQRVRVLGSARLGTDDAHIGVEFWARYPLAHVQAGINDANRADLIAYADGVLAAKATAGAA